jgi:hypothetical protein
MKGLKAESKKGIQSWFVGGREFIECSVDSCLERSEVRIVFGIERLFLTNVQSLSIRLRLGE